MTREEAIGRIREHMIVHEMNESRAIYITKALEMAIEALEKNESAEEWYKLFVEKLEQESKTGHWEWVQYDYNPKLGNWHCSECRCVVIECVDKEEKGGIPSYKYCPQCGTKMIESESE